VYNAGGIGEDGENKKSKEKGREKNARSCVDIIQDKLY